MTDNLDHYDGSGRCQDQQLHLGCPLRLVHRDGKARLKSGDAEQPVNARRVLVYVLDKALKLLHPSCPSSPRSCIRPCRAQAETIMTQSWPTVDDAYQLAGGTFEVMDYIKAVRTIAPRWCLLPRRLA